MEKTKAYIEGNNTVFFPLSSVKQMKLLHPVNDRPDAGFSPDERSEARKAIYDNVVDSMVAILEAMEAMGIHMEGDSKIEEDKFKVLIASYITNTVYDVSCLKDEDDEKLF